MKNKVVIGILAFCLGINNLSMADEGMWLPLLLGKNYSEMQRLGLKLTSQQLYDINNASLKDAIVMLDNGGCTGELISPEGLLLTNHHCGYDDIQQHSSVEHDYLTDGFWAMSKDEEFPNQGKTASFLVRIEDVSSKVLADVTDKMTEAERNGKISAAISKIEKEAVKGTGYDAKVKNMLAGNEYYLFVYETFLDVRLVGAPPSSIGKFGGDTDNWMWPRHTGDFSIFRVYTGPDGKPAKYSPNNVPLKSKHFLPVSVKGINKNDFAMIWGYPGTTERYLSSYGINLKIEQINPTTVKLRDIKMKIMKEYMDNDPKIRIQYASKYALLGNFWKKDKEMIKALKKLKVYDQKKAEEDEFQKWANADAAKKEKYGNVIPDLAQCYKNIAEKKYDIAFWSYVELAFMSGAEIINFSNKSQGLKSTLSKDGDVTAMAESLRETSKEHFKDYNGEIDKKVLAAMLDMFYKNVPEDLQFDALKDAAKKFKGDFTKYAEYVFSKSVFSSPEKFEKFLTKPSFKILDKDPALLLATSMMGTFMKMEMSKGDSESKLSKAKRLYIAGLREMHPEKNYYPDANSTMRCTFGTVKDFSPGDAVQFNYYTTLAGVMEKEDPTNDEFVVAPKLKELYQKKDYGIYGMGDAMPLDFLTNNDITGGNSGSPVINGNGELIGTAFDGNADAMSSDVQFDPNLQRTIVCDIRYVLFVIDKYAGAKNLINEMKLVSN